MASHFPSRSLNVDLKCVDCLLQECFLVAGHDSTIGMGGLIGAKVAKDGAVVEMLKSQGAVPFCLTNVPQTMVSAQIILAN